jgi:uncharacterized protein GlcG (DUF336 family)
MKKTTLLVLAGLALPLSVEAQVLQERNISLAVANELALAVVQACAAKNFNVTATVVDRAGLIRAMLRGDKAGPHTIDSSRMKAYTSASARNTTTAMMENAEKNPAAKNISNITGLLLLGGGVPIRVGDDVIGAVGVGGAPGGHLDEECANAGIAAVQSKLN